MILYFQCVLRTRKKERKKGIIFSNIHILLKYLLISIRSNALLFKNLGSGIVLKETFTIKLIKGDSKDDYNATKLGSFELSIYFIKNNLEFLCSSTIVCSTDNTTCFLSTK